MAFDLGRLGLNATTTVPGGQQFTGVQRSALLFGGLPTEMHTTTRSYPARHTGQLNTPPSSGLWVGKWLLAVPHYFILFFLGSPFFSPQSFSGSPSCSQATT